MNSLRSILVLTCTGFSASDADTAEDSRPGYFAGGHNVSALLVCSAVVFNIEAGLLLAVSLAWRSSV